MDSSDCKNPPLVFSTDLTRAFANTFSSLFFLILVFLAFKSMIQWILQGSAASTQTDLPVQQQQQQQTCSSSPEAAAAAAAAALLAAIPVLIYSSSECESCSICLDGFVHGDTIRVLPRCKHMFHKDCIDEWLPSRSIFCPVCRDRTIGAEEGLENLNQNDEGGRTNNCNRNSGSSSSSSSSVAPPPVIIDVVSQSEQHFQQSSVIINVVSLSSISSNPL